MNRLMSTRLVLCRAASLSVRSRPITYTQTTIKQTTTISDDPNVAAAAADAITETFVTSELNKVGVVTQKEFIDGDGTVKRQTIPPEKWDADLASTSEEIIKAERRHPEKEFSIEKMQQKSLKGLEEKEQKMAHAKKNNEEM